MAKTRSEYRTVGARFVSGAVGQEAREAEQRWKEDIEVLQCYGYTRQNLARFHGLTLEHDGLLAARPAAIGAKIRAVNRSYTIEREGRLWLDRAMANLCVLALSQPTLEEELSIIETRNSNELDAQITACVALLKMYRRAIDADVDPGALITEGEFLVPHLETLNPEKAGTKTTALAETEEIDVLDGKLIEIISGLNSAGRKAFRALKNFTKVEAYKYHYLRCKPSETATDAPAEACESHSAAMH